jgi:hypothetical protein
VSSLSQRSLVHLGMDVHKDSISIGILRPDDSMDVERIFHDEESVRRFIARMGEPRRLVACYEAGPWWAPPRSWTSPFRRAPIPTSCCSGTTSRLGRQSTVPWYFHQANKYGLTQLQRLTELPPQGALVIAGPLPIVDGSGSPARVLALVERP